MAIVNKAIVHKYPDTINLTKISSFLHSLSRNPLVLIRELPIRALWNDKSKKVKLIVPTT